MSGGVDRQRPAANRSQLLTMAPIVVFDIAGPLVLFYWLSGNGFSTVDALILSGLLPAFNIGLGVVRHRRLDAIGALVLIGIIVGTVAGLLSGSAHVVLLDGIIPTAVFGFVCLGSLWSARPLMFRFAIEMMGADTPNGRDFADKWRYEEFRRAFVIITVVWGLAFLVEALIQLVIIQVASTDVAKTTSNFLPLIVIGVVVVWNIAYGKRGQRKGQLAEAASRARADIPPEMPA
jgi:uncharacterized membrane protein